MLSKHDGIHPDPTELDAHVGNARQFLEQASQLIFKTNFWTTSLVDLLDQGEQRTILEEAEREFGNKNFAVCLVLCRRAFYLEFEANYDIQIFAEGDVWNALATFGNKAPYFTRNKDYIQKHVKDPFDYIQLDHTRVDADLVREGIDPNTFWNVWRLTPSVYRHRRADEWAVRQDAKVFDKEGIEARAAYVLETVVELLLKVTLRRRSQKWFRSSEFTISLRRSETPIYESADRNSAIIATTPKDQLVIDVQYAAPGLREKSHYWKVAYWVGEAPEPGSKWVSGYVHSDDVTESS